MGSTRAAISLGSNLGDRRAHLAGAIDALAGSPGIDVLAVSTHHETAPIGGPSGQGAFLNAAATLDTTLGPEALLGRLREVEATGGRTREVRWDARTIDLDLILFDSETRDGPDLILPHPRFPLRRFVLAPLAEVAPGWVDPITRRTVADLLANLDRRPSVVLVGGVAGDDSETTRAVFEGVRRILPAGWEAIDMLQTSMEPTFAVRLDRPARWPRISWPLLTPEATDPDGIVAEILATCASIHPA